jgi:hypothetical protein
VKSSNLKTVLGLKNSLQNNNNLQKTSPFSRKKGAPHKKSATCPEKKVHIEAPAQNKKQKSTKSQSFRHKSFEFVYV